MKVKIGKKTCRIGVAMVSESLYSNKVGVWGELELVRFLVFYDIRFPMSTYH